MNKPTVSFTRTLLTLSFVLPLSFGSKAATPTILFQDDFTGGIPGWTAVQPAGVTYIDGPMLWQYDKVADAFSEDSNIYTDSSAFSTTRFTVMLINSTLTPDSFTYTARLSCGDDDAFGRGISAAD